MPVAGSGKRSAKRSCIDNQVDMATLGDAVGAAFSAAFVNAVKIVLESMGSHAEEKPLVRARGLRLKQVRERLGVSTNTVYRLADEGVLKRFKVRGDWRYTEESVQAYIDSQIEDR
ncbi:MAG: helix-turn-helix domain-containing protein [Pirellulales bacterium]|nr:helix-turn-helix domain-containing protein [Pirellulales bacterium]